MAGADCRAYLLCLLIVPFLRRGYEELGGWSDRLPLAVFPGLDRGCWWLVGIGNVVNLLLCDYRTNVLLAMRTLSLNEAVTGSIRQVLRGQIEKYADGQVVNREVNRIVDSFSTEEMILKTALYQPSGSTQASAGEGKTRPPAPPGKASVAQIKARLGLRFTRGKTKP